MKTLEEIGREYANKPPIIIDTEDFREDLKDLLCEVEFIKSKKAEILEVSKESFNAETEPYKTWEEKEAILTEMINEIVADLEDYKNSDLNVYTDLINLYIDTTPLKEEYVLETCLKTYYPVLILLAELEIGGIFKLLDTYFGKEIASFIAGVSVNGDSIDRRKLPKWVLKNYRYMIEEIERLLTRAYAIEKTVINAIANSVPIGDIPPESEPENQQKEDKRAYTFHDDTAQYSYSELSKALTTQENRRLNVRENELNLQVLLSGTEESEEKIKKLSPIEKKILDTIVKFFIERKYEFTDQEIAREVYGTEDRENGVFTKPTEAQLNGVNKAIEKIRTTMIEIKGEAKKKDVFFNSRNPFIDVFNIGTKDESSKTQYYKINNVPFYYTYIVRTGGKFIEYDNRAFTRKIDGIKKTEKAQNLRIYLTEKISNICLGYDVPYIDLKEIYNLENVQAETRKQKHDIIKTVWAYLEDLQKQYSFKPEAAYKGKTIKGYNIKVENRE